MLEENALYLNILLLEVAATEPPRVLVDKLNGGVPLVTVISAEKDVPLVVVTFSQEKDSVGTATVALHDPLHVVEAPAPSETETVNVPEPAEDGNVPEYAPVEELIDNQDGPEDMEQLYGVVPLDAEAEPDTDAPVLPDILSAEQDSCATGSTASQDAVQLTVVLLASVTLTVKVPEPSEDGNVPEYVPEEEPIDSQEGAPDRV